MYGAPGPEPFAVFSVTEQITAKQLLDMVSSSQKQFSLVLLLSIWSHIKHHHHPALPPPPALQVIASAGGNPYFLCEEKVPLSRERSETKRCSQHRPLAPEEEVVRLISSWSTEEGYVGRICLKLREEVYTQSADI